MLALYIRIFAPKKWLRITSYTTLVVTFLFYFVNIPLLGVYCVPRSGEGWDIQLMLRCAKTSIMAPILGAVSIAADVFILFLPLPIVLRLNLAPKRKLGLALVFLAGVLYVMLQIAKAIFANTEKRPHCQLCILLLPDWYLQRRGQILEYDQCQCLHVSETPRFNRRDSFRLFAFSDLILHNERRELTLSIAWQKAMSPLWSAVRLPSIRSGQTVSPNRPFILAFDLVRFSLGHRARQLPKIQMQAIRKR